MAKERAGGPCDSASAIRHKFVTCEYVIETSNARSSLSCEVWHFLLVSEHRLYTVKKYRYTSRVPQAVPAVTCHGLQLATVRQPTM